MAKNYEITEFTVESLYVNPDNARYINADELPDEIAAIKQLVKMYQFDISKLAEDISLKGLNPNELPVIIPGPDDDNKYLVMDGNRRITSIKLMTQYKDRLEELGLSPASRRFFQNLQCDIKVVTCVLFEKEDRRVNDLLEKLHTSKPGISQKKWDPQAQDRHQFKNGGITKRLAIIEMLRSSDYTSSEARNALNQGGWTSKLKRFAEYEASFFGIGFDKENNIILFLEEKEVMKGLSQLVIDLMTTKAIEVAQTVEVRQRYLDKFPSDKKPNPGKINNPPIAFKVESKTFEIIDSNLDLFNCDPPPNDQNTEKQTKEESEKTTDQNNNEKSNYNGTTSEHTNNSSKSTSTSNENTDSEKDNYNTDEDKDDSSTSQKTGTQGTLERSTLIPKDENIPISDQRTKDLYNELKVVHIRYVNVISTSFRSLIEFSLNIFLKKKNSNLAFNEQVTLFVKLEKVVRMLESIHTKPKLEEEIPAIYRSINSFNQDRTSDLSSIQLLNILIHNYNYHPTEKELKILYNNYSRFLTLIWDQL